MKVSKDKIIKCQLVGAGVGIAMKCTREIAAEFDSYIDYPAIKACFVNGRIDPDKVVESDLPRNLVFALGSLAAVMAVEDKSNRVFTEMFDEGLIEAAKTDAKENLLDMADKMDQIKGAIERALKDEQN